MPYVQLRPWFASPKNVGGYTIEAGPIMNLFRIVTSEMCIGDMHSGRVREENAMIMRDSPELYRETRSKFQSRISKEQIVELSDRVMERIWEHL
jgi:hypothetical protein